MKALVLLLITILVFSAISPVFGQTPEDEKIAKSLYLKASKAIRAENYQEAVSLLTEILDEYSDSEVALKADEKLTEIADKAKIANLPKTPGSYWVETDGKILEMATKALQKDAPYEYGTVWATFSLDQIPQIFADELSKFIVYRPKGDLQDVYWTRFYSISTLDAKGKYVPSGNFGMLKEWEVPSVDGGPFGSSQVVFDEIKPGMWEVGFPSVFSPAYPVICGLIDGTNQVRLVIVSSKMVHSFYTFLEIWDKPKLDYASSKYISKQMAKHPNNPDLVFFDAILKYKMAYKEDRDQTEALAAARKAIELSQSNEITPKVVTDLSVLVEYCIADSVVRANSIDWVDSPEVRSQKHSALQAYYSEKVPTDLFWIQEQIARNHAFVGEYDEAILVAEKAVKNFKDKKPNFGTSLFGIKIKLEVESSIGPPKMPDAFDIHDALSCYILKPEWECFKDLKKEMESERFLGEALTLMESGGTDKEIEKALKNAKKKNKNNIPCYEAMVKFYTKLGKSKDAQKAEKDIKKANKRLTKLEMSRKNS